MNYSLIIHCFIENSEYPTAFEFNESFLFYICDGYYSSLFGTFLANSDLMAYVLFCFVFKHVVESEKSFILSLFK